MRPARARIALPLTIAALALGCRTFDDKGLTDRDPAADTELDTDGDSDVDTPPDSDEDTDAAAPLPLIRGRLESAGPVRACHELASWTAPDGLLLRMHMDVCGADMAALAETIVANLDAVAARGGEAMLDLGQGPFLPADWLDACATYTLSDPRFAGPLCLPWDASYQANLHAALVDHIGPAVLGHPALAGVYFTISTMTNGSEMHFRVERSTFPYPGDATFRQAYLDVMDTFQEAFAVPVVFEAGHCIWTDLPGGAVEPEDCQTPLDLYRHARDTYGADHIGLAVWNCAERFWSTPTAIGAGTRALLEEATADGVSMGCQTVSSFRDGACQFSDPTVADYGTASGIGPTACAASVGLDPVSACVDTFDWFSGQGMRSPDSIVLHGTWAEVWSADVSASGTYATSADCRAAVDVLAP